MVARGAFNISPTSPHLHWTRVYVSNVHRWSKQMVAGEVWKISATYQQMARWVNAVTTELSAFWSKFTRSLYFQHCACFNTAIIHCASLVLPPPSMSCIHCTLITTSHHITTVSFCTARTPPLRFSSMSCIHCFIDQWPPCFASYSAQYQYFFSSCKPVTNFTGMKSLQFCSSEFKQTHE